MHSKYYVFLSFVRSHVAQTYLELSVYLRMTLNSWSICLYS